MNYERLAIENRIALLLSRDRENRGIVNKLMRKLRKLDA